MSTPNSDFIPHPTNHLFYGAFEALALPGRLFGNAGIMCGSFFKHKHMSLQQCDSWSICFPPLQDDYFLPFPHPASSTPLLLQFTLSWWSWFPFHWESISKIKEEHLCFPWQSASSLVLPQLSCLLHHRFSNELDGSFHDMYAVPFLLS